MECKLPYLKSLIDTYRIAVVALLEVKNDQP